MNNSLVFSGWFLCGRENFSRPARHLKSIAQLRLQTVIIKSFDRELYITAVYSRRKKLTERSWPLLNRPHILFILLYHVFNNGSFMYRKRNALPFAYWY